MTTNQQRRVEDGQIVTLHYTLTNSEGEVLDSSEDSEPLLYLHGGGNIVPGLENALTGHVAGDHLQVTVKPADGYGDRVGPGPRPVPRNEFPDDVDLEPGMQFLTEGAGGEAVPVWITDVGADTVQVDFNHPLAGETLHFDVTVVETRPATEEEMEHGHPHGPEGHHHH